MFGMAATTSAMLERLIVRHSKDPSLQVRARLALPKVLKKRQKHLLRDFLSVGGRNSERHQITKNRRPKLLEQGNDFLFQPGRPGCRGSRALACQTAEFSP